VLKYVYGVMLAGGVLLFLGGVLFLFLRGSCMGVCFCLVLGVCLQCFFLHVFTHRAMLLFCNNNSIIAYIPQCYLDKDVLIYHITKNMCQINGHTSK